MEGGAASTASVSVPKDSLDLAVKNVRDTTLVQKDIHLLLMIFTQWNGSLFFSYNFLSINKFKSLNNTTTFSYYSFLVKYGKSCNKTREKRIWFISYISTEQFYNFYNSADIYLFVALRKLLRLFSDSYWWIFTFHSHVRPRVWE